MLINPTNRGRNKHILKRLGTSMVQSTPKQTWLFTVLTVNYNPRFLITAIFESFTTLES